MNKTPDNTNTPTAIRHGKRITHYVYRGVRIDRWVNDRGYNIGTTTMYVTAGTKFAVTLINKNGKKDDYVVSSLKQITRHIDRNLDGFKLFGGSTTFYRAENGKLVFDYTHSPEVAN